MSSGWEELTLENVAGGALRHYWERCLGEVKADMEDAEKEPEDRRTITLKVQFLPVEAGGPMGVSVVGETKLAKRIPTVGGALLERGRLLAYRYTQSELFEFGDRRLKGLEPGDTDPPEAS